jgi:hypothetical protein
MKKTMLFVATSLLLAGVVSLQAAEPAKKEATKKEAAKTGEKPKASPGWIVIEEDFWVPWRFEPIDWLHDARVHYRQKEEKAAANELRKAETWLKFAASHALPETKKSLETAAADLGALANDIAQGKLVTANRLDYAMASADNALARWHYFKAKDSLGRSDEKVAAQHLEAAARYLQHAANSARYEYGADTVLFFEDVSKYGDFATDEVIVEPNRLADNLQSLEKAIQQMSGVLKKSAEK